MNDLDIYQLPDPIASGAASGENSNASATKQNYKEEFYPPPFVHYVKRPKFTLGNQLSRYGNGRILYEGVLSNSSEPNIDFLHSKGISINSHPSNWFNFLMSINFKRKSHSDEVTIGYFTSWTNKKLILMNAGPCGSIYPNYKKFAVDEVMKHIGIYAFT